ncbi:MAG: alpha/beta hydrolase fold domain-containing protein [Kiritimatiellia bacterium]
MSLKRSDDSFEGQPVIRFSHEHSRGMMVWFHGGGWMIPLGDDALLWGEDLAKATGYDVVLPDYPLARDYAYPLCDQWCCSFWKHLADEAQVKKQSLILGGDSAGAHLALATLSVALPAKAVFIYAVTTLLPQRETGSWANYQKKWPLSPRLMDYFCDAYCPDHALRLQASPLETLTALPPTLLITATNDILADQQEAFAKKFHATQLRYEGATHIFLSRPEGAKYRTRALRDITDWLIPTV